MKPVSPLTLIGQGLLILGLACLCACSTSRDASRHRGPLDNAARQIAVEVVQSAGIGEVWTRAQLPIEIGIYVSNSRLRRRCGEKYESEARAFVRLVSSPSFPLVVRRSDNPARIALLIASNEELPAYFAQWDRTFGTERLASLYSVRDRVTDDQVNVLGRSSTIEVAVAIITSTPERLPLFDDCNLRVRTYLSLLVSQFKAYAAGGLAASRIDFQPEELTERALGLIAEAVHGEMAAGRPAAKEAVLARLRLP